MTPRPERVEVKHIEARGIGYKQGYTSLQGFFPILATLNANWVPFFDFRAHIFNDGHPDINAGLGARFLDHARSRTWGANLYYDYRKTSRFHYNQVGAGLETLGDLWDFRINGYFPVGTRTSSPYRFKFHRFKGNSLILSNKREFAMTGTNAELGAHVYQRGRLDLYTAFGPYYFKGQNRTAWGGEGRVALTAWDHCRVQVNASYDTIFKTIVQGEASLFFSWGGKKEIKKRSSSMCSDSSMIVHRALQRVDRQEITVLDTKHEKSKAIDPATGQPYTFYFVNNTSHSQGTFASPFNTLLAAQNASSPNDVIYVFAGDGTDTGMNSGITLQYGQQLLGAGIDQTIATTRGTITVPAQGTGLPLISNANDLTELGVQLVAGNNVLSGLDLEDKLGTPIGTIFSGAVTIRNGSNYLIKNNQFKAFNFGAGINVYGLGDNTTIVNNTFLATSGFNQADGVFFYDILTPITGSFYIASNLFTGVDDSSGFNIAISTFDYGVPLKVTSVVSVTIDSNTFVGQTNVASTPAAILFGADNATLSIIGNYIDMTGFPSPTAGIYLEQDSASGLMSATLQNNVSLTNSPVPGYLFVNNSGTPYGMQINFGPSNIGTRVGP